MALYTIGEVAQLCDINPVTLRAWQRRYELLNRSAPMAVIDYSMTMKLSVFAKLSAGLMPAYRSAR